MSSSLAQMSVAPTDVFRMAAQRYTGVAAISLVVYDIVITLDNEVRYFWGRSFSLIQLIYFLNRYYGLVVLSVGDMIETFSDAQYDLSSRLVFCALLTFVVRCKFIVQFGAWSGWTMILLADAIMTLRVHALFERRRIMTVFLGSLYLAQGLAMMGMLIGYDRNFDDFAWHALQACGAVAPSWNSIFWIPPLTFEFILLCMTLYKVMSYSSSIVCGGNYRVNSLYRILVRDQVIYFASILLSGCLNIMLWEFISDGSPNNEGITLSVAIPCVLGGRILIGLREAADRQEEDLIEDAESPMVFDG